MDCLSEEGIRVEKPPHLTLSQKGGHDNEGERWLMGVQWLDDEEVVNALRMYTIFACGIVCWTL